MTRRTHFTRARPERKRYGETGSLRAAKCVRVRLHARVRARGCIGGDRRMKEADIGREKDGILSLSLSLSRQASKGSFATEILNYNAAGSLV